MLEPQKEAVDRKHDKGVPLTKEQQKLVEGKYELVKKIAEKMLGTIKNNGSNQRLVDFISWGAEGLIEAAKHFESSNGASFDTYASIIIRGRILDNLRKESVLSRVHFDFLKEREKAVEAAIHRFHREPTEGEVASEMGLTLEQYQKRLKKYPVGAGVVFESRRIDDEEPQNGFLDEIALEMDPHIPGSSNPEILKSDVTKLLNIFLSELDENSMQRKVIDKHFFKGMTLKDVGKELGLTESRICQINGEVIRELRKLFKKEGY